MAGTRWARIDLDYVRNPKIGGAGREAAWLHLTSILWCATYLTDGHIPAGSVPAVLREAHVNRAAVDRLLAAGLWESNGGGFVVHDFAEMNPTRDDVETRRAQLRERQRRWRERRGRDE